MIGSEKSTEHRQRNETICRTHRESIRSERIQKFSNKGKLEVWGINSTLGIYQIAVYLRNSGNVVGQEN